MLTKHQPLANMISQNPELILVSERLEIFPGFGDKTIEEIAADKDINPDLLLLLLEMQLKPDQIPNIELPVDDIEKIVDFLSISHDYYTQELYPVIAKNIDLLAEKNKHPSVQMVKLFFNEYKEEAARHFEYENETAFPYIRNLYKTEQSPSQQVPEEYSADTYRENHDNIEEKMDDLKQLLIKYLPCEESDFRIRRNLVFVLDRLDCDLKAHAKIENEVLIPLVRKLEKSKEQNG